MADTERCGCVAHRQPLAVFVGGAVAVDGMDAAQRADAMRRPGLALASWQSHSVQRGSDVLIRPTAGHGGDDGERLLRSMTAVLAGSWFTDAQLGMLTAFPVDDEHDLTGRLVDIGDNLRDQRPYQSLARPHRGPLRLPRCREIVGQFCEVRMSIVGIRRLHLIESLLATLDALQCSLPRLLPLCCNQPIIGVASRIAAFVERC